MKPSLRFMARELFLYISEKIGGESFHTFNEITTLAPHYNSDKFFFVQIGANDGKTGDPLHKFVMKYHWSGLLVEPVKEYYSMLQQTYAGNTNLVFENAAISEKNQQKTMYRIRNDVKHIPKGLQGIASFDKSVLLRHNFILPDFESYITEEKVDCVTLKELLKKHDVEKIDLLCLDTEGYEFKILKQLDTVKVKPHIIFYEHKHLNDAERLECEQFLTGLGYAMMKKFDNTIAYQKTA